MQALYTYSVGFIQASLAYIEKELSDLINSATLTDLNVKHQIFFLHQLSTDFVENLGAKVKNSLEKKGFSLVESYSAGFRAQMSSQNREAVLIHPMSEPLLD